MKTLLVVMIVFLLVSLVVIVILAHNAPEGWEDQDGFHKGKRNG